jgi:hypothetical protein
MDKKTIAEFIRKQKVAFICSVDEEGFPNGRLNFGVPVCKFKCRRSFFRKIKRRKGTF